MHMEEIQYTYKPCILFFMESIHENDIYTWYIKIQNGIHDKLKHIEVSFYK